mgnify:CR=1 FL=1
MHRGKYFIQKKSKKLNIGEGKISGALSIFFSLISLGAVACFLFPEYLTTQDFRINYPLEVFRWLVFACLVFSFVFALLSFLLSKSIKMASLGMFISALAILLGGAGIEIKEFEQSLFSISLDWMLLEILVFSIVFIPIELFLPKRPEQTKFHPEWKTDLVYLFKAQLLIQYTAVAVKQPAELFFSGIGTEALQNSISSLPFMLQLFLAMFVADLFQYWIHRLFHGNSFLWRFHSIHHSIKYVDWISGSRLHLVDIFITRSISYIPLYILGFATDVFYVYVVFVSVQAVMAHANTSISFGFLKYCLVTPQYHHWHHSKDSKTHGGGGGGGGPFIDKLFGTYYLPNHEWPHEMGLINESFPSGYFRQQIYPFTHDPKSAQPNNPSTR